MAYIVTFRGHIVAGPFNNEYDAVQARSEQYQRPGNPYGLSEFEIERI